MSERLTGARVPKLPECARHGFANLGDRVLQLSDEGHDRTQVSEVRERASYLHANGGIGVVQPAQQGRNRLLRVLATERGRRGSTDRRFRVAKGAGERGDRARVGKSPCDLAGRDSNRRFTFAEPTENDLGGSRDPSEHGGAGGSDAHFEIGVVEAAENQRRGDSRTKRMKFVGGRPSHPRVG